MVTEITPIPVIASIGLGALHYSGAIRSISALSFWLE
jgi:hypothetical protein